MKTYRIGRGPGNDITFSNPEVSNDHAELIEDNGTYTLIDHSKNGTIINGNRIHNASCYVRYGDTILFAGKERFNWDMVAHRRTGTALGIGGNYGGDVSNQRNAPYGIASMVLGIASLVLSVKPLISLAMAIVGLCLGVSGSKKIKGQEHLYKGVGMLKAGKICSIITLSIIGLVLIVGLSLGLGLIFSLSEFL